MFSQPYLVPKKIVLQPGVTVKHSTNYPMRYYSLPEEKAFPSPEEITSYETKEQASEVGLPRYV